MTWMSHTERMKEAIQNATKAKMLAGARLILSEDIYDTDQVNMYEPLLGSQSVMCVGTIIKDALSEELASLLNDNVAIVVEFNVIGIAPHYMTVKRGG